MSSPAASALPLAVLVLAWDETTPAVRALLEGTPTPALASLLVLVPAETPAILSAEEPLPYPNHEADDEPAPAPPAVTAAPEPHLLPFAPALPELAPLPAAAARPSPLPSPQPWAAVRVLHLSDHTLPELAHRAGQPLPAPTWMGAATTPAAPYQGATPPPLVSSEAARPPAPVSGQATALATSFLPPAYEPAEPLALAPDAEADWPLAFVGEELLRVESGVKEAATETPALSPLTEPGDWAAALAALRQPVALPEAAVPTPPAAPGAAAAPPTNGPYNVPNLNFQVIQYARFAVPVALAEAPYAVIYAPAWPTWLAAQELRQRTGRPLVLHVAALAAPADASLETATGWMAELQRQALRRADVILTETYALAQRLCHELSLPGSCVHTVPAADAKAVAQALHAARPRPAAVPT